MRIRLLLVCLNLIMMFCIACALLSVYIIYHVESGRKAESNHAYIVPKCKRYEMDREIYQYGDYWVMSHVVKASEEFEQNSCFARVALLIHGTSDIIYNIRESFVECKDKNVTMDVAVYLSTPYDLDNTIAAITYMTNCYINKAIIRRKVNFHLYFHMDILAFMPIPQYIDIIVQMGMNCMDHMATRMQNFSLNVTAEKQAEIEVVGQNILRQVSFSHYHIPIDVMEESDNSMCIQLQQELIDYETVLRFINDTDAARDERIIYRRPTLLFVKTAEGSEPVKNFSPYDTPEWLADNHTVAFKNVSRTFKDLIIQESKFVMYWHAPLLDDRVGITGKQREHLFLLRAMHENMRIIFLHNGASVHKPLLQSELKLMNASQNQLDFDKGILQEYNILFK